METEPGKITCSGQESLVCEGALNTYCYEARIGKRSLVHPLGDIAISKENLLTWWGEMGVEAQNQPQPKKQGTLEAKLSEDVSPTRGLLSGLLKSLSTAETSTSLGDRPAGSLPTTCHSSRSHSLLHLP